MVDFLQITSLPKDDLFTLRSRERDYGLGTSAVKTIWKMGVMASGHKVLYIIFGHTHEADLQRLSGVSGGEYVNCGSWTKIFSKSHRTIDKK